MPLAIVLRTLIECDDKSIYLAITEGSTDGFITDRVLAMLKYAQELNRDKPLLTHEAARDYLGAHFAKTIGAPSHWTNDQSCQLLLDRYLFPHLTGKPASAKFD